MGEVIHDEDSFKREVLDRLITIETKLDGVESAKRVSYENQRDIIAIKKDNEEQSARILALEDKHKFMSHALTTAIITALISLVFAFVQIGMGLK